MCNVIPPILRDKQNKIFVVFEILANVLLTLINWLLKPKCMLKHWFLVYVKKNMSFFSFETRGRMHKNIFFSIVFVFLEVLTKTEYFNTRFVYILFLEMTKKHTEIKQNGVKQYTWGNHKYWKIFFLLIIFFWNGLDPTQICGLDRTRPKCMSPARVNSALHFSHATWTVEAGSEGEEAGERRRGEGLTYGGCHCWRSCWRRKAAAQVMALAVRAGRRWLCFFPPFLSSVLRSLLCFFFFFFYSLFFFLLSISSLLLLSVFFFVVLFSSSPRQNVTEFTLVLNLWFVQSSLQLQFWL